jgi:hypothetical protein
VPGYSAAYGTGYVAQIPGGTVGRCNPVNAPPECVSAELDTIFSAAPPPTSHTEQTPPGPPTTTTSGTGSQGPPSAEPATPVPGDAAFTG